METKTFEIRDRATFIPAIAIRLSPSCEEDRYLLARAGYGRAAEDQGEYVLLGRIAGGEDMRFNHDPYAWGMSRTMVYAHEHIRKNWASLVSGQVICVEHLLGERPEPKKSEREE